MSTRKGDKTPKPFFNPLSVATAIAEAINIDLASTNAVQVDPRYVDYFRRIQSVSTLKKFEVEQEKEALEKAAFDSFLALNHSLSLVNGSLSRYFGEGLSDNTENGYILRRARGIVRRALGDITTEEIFHAARHSGGTTLNVPFSDTSISRKFQLPISATQRASLVMESYFGFDTKSKLAIESVAGPYDRGKWFEIVSESRATTVPKNSTKRRMIVVEPTANMFMQQGLMAVMYERLKRVGLDVTSLPSEHKRLAFRGSVSGKTATIDFSEASNCNLIELIRYLFPAKWFYWLDILRCDTISLQGKSVKLEAVSTMGNATTFPVETLVFWSLAVACAMWSTFSTAHRNSPLASPYRILPTLEEFRSVSVFGDDCIVDQANADLFCRIASFVGFSTNVEKTFCDPGPGFRESCGGDYYHGRDVRPFNIKAPTSAKRSAYEPWLYTVLNGAVQKYISYFGPTAYVYDKELFKLIAMLFREAKLLVKLVPSEYPLDSGLVDLDSARLIGNYDFKMSPLKVSNDGTTLFSYLRFKYRDKVGRDDYVCYADWLKSNRNRHAKRLPWLSEPGKGVVTITRVRTSDKGVPIRTSHRVDQLPLFIEDVSNTPVKEHWGSTPIRRIGGYSVASAKTPFFPLSLAIKNR